MGVIGKVLVLPLFIVGGMAVLLQLGLPTNMIQLALFLGLLFTFSAVVKELRM